MSDPLISTGSYSTEIIGEEPRWVELGEGNLRFDNSYLKFKNENILIKTISHGKLEFQTVNSLLMQQLSFRSGGRNYTFHITTEIERSHVFPFEVERSKRETFISQTAMPGKFALYFVLVCITLNILFLGAVHFFTQN